jgi:hypothetical protein
MIAEGLPNSVRRRRLDRRDRSKGQGKAGLTDRKTHGSLTRRLQPDTRLGDANTLPITGRSQRAARAALRNAPRTASIAPRGCLGGQRRVKAASDVGAPGRERAFAFACKVKTVAVLTKTVNIPNTNGLNVPQIAICPPVVNKCGEEQLIVTVGLPFATLRIEAERLPGCAGPRGRAFRPCRDDQGRVSVDGRYPKRVTWNLAALAPLLVPERPNPRRMRGRWKRVTTPQRLFNHLRMPTATSR